MSYVCTSCGQTHEGLPDIAFDQPGYSNSVPKEEREKRVQLDTDLCVVDGEYYFIRGIIEIPIHGQEETNGSPSGIGTAQWYFVGRCLGVRA